MELAHFIKDLLYNHDVVIIPEFGGLVKKYKPAEINSSDNSILPPSKFVLFDSTLVVSDGLLASHIAEQKAIPVKEADNYIAQEVKAMNRKLDTGEPVILEGIGYFSKEDGKLRFEREDINFFTDSYGLSKVEYKAEVIKHSPPITTPKEHFEKKERRNLFPVYMFLAILVIVGGGVLAYLIYPVEIGRFLKITTSEKDSQKHSSETINKDTSKTSDLENFFDSATDKKKALAPDKQPPKGLTSRVDGNYYIVAGSFVDFERASKYSKQLDKEGLKSEVVQFNQETFRVIVGEYNDKNKAIEELLKIRAAKGDDAVWLLSK